MPWARNSGKCLDQDHLVRTERAVDDIHDRGASDGKTRGFGMHADSGQE